MPEASAASRPEPTAPAIAPAPPSVASRGRAPGVSLRELAVELGGSGPLPSVRRGQHHGTVVTLTDSAADALPQGLPAVLAWRWELIRQHPLDTCDLAGEGAGIDLVGFLAGEHGWAVDRARRAVQEYRHFCLLALDTGGAARPSGDVALAWRAHLLFTRDYWGTFCPNVLGLELHLRPDVADPALTPCRATLDRYRELFGHQAPTAPWSAHSPRAQETLVDPRRYWMVPKPWARHVAGGLAVVGILLALGWMI